MPNLAWISRATPWQWLGLAVLSFLALLAEIALLGLVQHPHTIIDWAANIVVSSACLLTSLLYVVAHLVTMYKLSDALRDWLNSKS